ncbi:MAG: hypothetical protein KJ645_13835 [Planctomycetes bacterium]|nr:hypothetical protein [Planctomycetota bacterium]
MKFNPNTSLLLVLLALLGGCSSTSPGHFHNANGRPLHEMDRLWEEVDSVFPGALPQQVKLVWVGGLHSSFMIEDGAIGIPSHMKSHIRRGKICRMLTHLALHALSGGDRIDPGRCFDNDVVFLEQAIAGYLDRKAAGLIEEERGEADRLAAEMFRTEGWTPDDLRDWETFYYRGYWSDQFQEWNLEGLRTLFSLGDYLERTFGLSAFGPVFQALAEGGSLDVAVRDVLGTELHALLEAWRDEVLNGVPEIADDSDSASPPAESRDAE